MRLGLTIVPTNRNTTGHSGQRSDSIQDAERRGIQIDHVRSDLTCTLLVTCAVEHVGYVVGGHGLGLELSAGQSDGDVLQGA